MDATISVPELERMRKAGTPFLLLDVRRQGDFDVDDVMIPGARRADPEHLDDWSRSLDREKPVVIYCVRGGSVSQSVSASLIERGFRVRYVDGGITAWKTQGGVGVPKASV